MPLHRQKSVCYKRFMNSIKHVLAVVGSLTLMAACGGSDSGDSDAASDSSGDPVEVVTEMWYDWWAGADGAAVATAESLDLAIEDVVDKDCIRSFVEQFSAEDLSIQANEEMVDISDAGYDILDQLGDECIDFTGG